jgi:DinB family
MKLFFSLLLSFFVFSVKAQNSFSDSLKQQLVADWVRAKAYTQEYLDAMPANKYGFRPTDSTRTFAEQMLHLAGGNVLLVSIGAGISNPFSNQNFEKSPGAQTKDSVVFYVNTSYDAVINGIRNMDAGKLTQVLSWDAPRGKRAETRLAYLLKAFEHQTHHRGQCVVYLRLSGIKPPAEKLF